MIWCCGKTLALRSVKKSSRGDEILDFRIELGFPTIQRNLQVRNLYSWRCGVVEPYFSKTPQKVNQILAVLKAPRITK